MTTDTGGTPPEAAVMQMVGGGFVAQIVRTMVVLGIPYRLAERPCTVSELAQLSGAHPPSLARLVRVLVSLDLCTYGQDNQIELTPLGETLRSDTPDSVASIALLVTAPWFLRIYENIPEAIRTGGAVCAQTHGVSYWEYLAAHPDAGNLMNAGMTGDLGGAPRCSRRQWHAPVHPTQLSVRLCNGQQGSIDGPGDRAV